MDGAGRVIYAGAGDDRFDGRDDDIDSDALAVLQKLLPSGGPFGGLQKK